MVCLDVVRAGPRRSAVKEVDGKQVLTVSKIEEAKK